MSMISYQIDELRVLEDWLRTTGQPRDALLVASAIYTIQALSEKVADQNLNRSEIPNSSDLISRQEVLSLIENTPYDWSNTTERTVMLWKIRALPSEDGPIGKWLSGQDSLDLQPTCNQLATTERNLINREDAINCIKWGEGVTDVIEQIKSLPSADRPTGKWLKRQTVGDVDFAYCSKCGAPIIHGRTSPLWSYCPNCGAEMKGETK